jgi:hypothetical protein
MLKDLLSLQVDVWAIGCVLYMLYNEGSMPFGRYDPAHARYGQLAYSFLLRSACATTPADPHYCVHLNAGSSTCECALTSC